MNIFRADRFWVGTWLGAAFGAATAGGFSWFVVLGLFAAAVNLVLMDHD